MAAPQAPATQWTPVVDPYGKLVQMDSAQVPDALRNGGFRMPTAGELQAHAEKQEFGTGILNPLEAGAESAASMMTLGGSRVAENALGLTTPEAQAARSKYNPVSSTLGTAAGIAAPLAASLVAGPEVGAAALSEAAGEGAGGAAGAEGAGLLARGAGAAKAALASPALPINAVGRAGRAIAEGLTPDAVETMGPLSKILAKGSAHMLGSSVEGAAFGLGQSVDESALGDPDALGEKLLPNLLTGAGIGGLIGGIGGAAGPALSAGIEGVGKMGPGMKSLGKKLLSTFGGMSEGDIDAYMAQREAVNSAPEFEDVYNHALGYVQDIHDQVQARQLDADRAASALADRKKEIIAAAQDLGFDARKAKSIAQDALDQAQEALQTKLQASAMDQAPVIAQAMEGLHDQVTQGSANSFDVLSQQEGMVPLRGFFQKAGELQGQLRAEATPEALGMADRIGQYVENVKAEHGTEVRPAAAKILIQGLDKVSKYDFNASSFDKGLSKYYKQLRYYLDDKIKDAFPDYRKAMEPVAQDSKLLKGLSDYGTPEDATRRIKSLRNVDRYRNEMPLLRQLEERTGAKFTSALEPYANPEMNEKLAQALPEYGRARESAAAFDAIQNPRMQRAMREIEGTPEWKAAQDAQTALEAATARKEALGLTEKNLQGQLKGTMTGKNIMAAKLASQLPGMEGKSIPDILEHIRLKEAFMKTATQGSRHVNLYSGIIGALGGALAGHALAGVGAGAALGGFMDKYGPQVTKKLLDTYANNAIHVGTLSALERAGNKTTQAVAQGAKAIFSGGGSGGSKIAAKSPEDHEKFAENLRGFTGNPDQMMNTLDHATRPIYLAAPNTSGALQTAAMRATHYLNQKLPELPPQKPFGPKMAPSPSQMTKFSHFHALIENPTRALDEVKAGTLTPDTMEALGTVYPKLLSEMQTHVMDALSTHLSKKNPEPIPYKTRMALSQFLGQDLDHSTEQASIASNQMALAQMGSSQAGAPGSGKVNAGAVGKMGGSARMMTASQATASRKIT